jgi:hypothetical protein
LEYALKRKDEIIRIRVRFDFAGKSRNGKFFFGGKDCEAVACENRGRYVELLKNVPIPGVKIENIDENLAVYRLFDYECGEECAYAPVEIFLCAHSLEDLVNFITREELRQVELLEPEELIFDRYKIQKLLFSFNSEIKNVLKGALKKEEK